MEVTTYGYVSLLESKVEENILDETVAMACYCHCACACHVKPDS